MNDEHSKTQSIYLMSESMKELKQRVKETDDRLREVEKIGNENQTNHKNTHEKLDSILKVCEDTEDRIRAVESTIIEHKTKWKFVGAISGVLGAGVAIVVKAVLDAWKAH